MTKTEDELVERLRAGDDLSARLEAADRIEELEPIVWAMAWSRHNSEVEAAVEQAKKLVPQNPPRFPVPLEEKDDG